MRDLLPADIDDLGLLIGPEARRKSVEIVISNTLTDNVRLPSTPIRQALLDLILNAVAAAPEGWQVCVSAEIVGEQLAIAVTDRGQGLPAMEAEVLTGRSGAPAPLDGGGLGLWTIAGSSPISGAGLLWNIRPQAVPP